MADTQTNTVTVFDEKAVKAWNTGRASDLLSWQGVSSAILALVGAYKQYQMYAQMGDLAEQQKKMIEQQMKLSLDAYNTMTKAQFNKASAYLWGYANTWGKGVIERVVACGTASCEYETDGSVYNRVAVQTAGIVNKAKRFGLRTVKVGQVGVCCDNDFRYAALQAGLMVKAIGVAEQFEAQKKFQWTQFYWQRQMSSAQLAQNAISTGANLLVGAGSSVNSALNGMTAIVGQSGQTAELGMKAASNMGGFFGSIAGLGGAGLGSIWGQNAGDRSSLFGQAQTTPGVGASGPPLFGAPSIGSAWGMDQNTAANLGGIGDLMPQVGK